ncbi:hypothetical protein SDRG_03951 [Saprolegnia diclina VS20]|uniref:OBG-type G domain-containing protein n=1 Tax=Saprolegnia diclina (strain VS20) TaxID=1156394 RepID=T0S279_SAPDV|nr:hypothetical protein SDRG_03951 [Saprolegnia diclina VS20]EQC38998.1 hypothetical protein SDRG_03951 [Saprolegnia diclina VS20]|eukprot:XP_008607822.1 hypothetical protein SDRG_03951 [Saprolegnia diclina VS20]
MELVIGCVGKPSAGKSTFFNAVTDGKAKVGNFPFTTIEPNEGITYYMTECPCKARGKTAVCAPKYGQCVDGTRHIPVKLLDVAGLIPGASEGAGLGNKFLDDLRHADVLMHIVDVSGTTNEKGETTIGYNPLNDADWLTSEIHNWIYNNLWKRWPSIARRHNATQAALRTTFQQQLSGYGASSSTVVAVLNALGEMAKEPCNLTAWGEPQVHALVDAFLAIRFPTILVLNKADVGAETDKNIANVAEKYGSDKCFVASAASECFLRNLHAKGFIKYDVGDMFFTTHEDDATLKVPEPKMAKRLEHVLDMVLFRHGSTGVRGAINAAVDLANMVVVYPVKSLKNFTTTEGDVFGHAVLVKKGATVREIAHVVSATVAANFAYAEGEDGRRLPEDEPITTPTLIIKFTTHASKEASGAPPPPADEKKPRKEKAKGAAADTAAETSLV